MIRKITLLLFTVFLMVASRATFTPVVVTGFNKDVVANGTGPVSLSAVAVDDKRDVFGYSFVTQDYRSPSNVAPTYYLPQNGLLTSPTAGLTYQLASYTGNNSLRLDTTGSTGTLTLTTPVNASDIYLAATSGGAGINTSNADVVVTFTDNTTFTSTISVRDWYDYTPVIVQGIGRVSVTDGGVDGAATNPRIYEYKITLAAANFGKSIQSIKFTRTNAFGLMHVMAVSVNTVSACGPPTTQPTNLVLTPTIYGVSGSFTASVPAASKYMVLRSAGTGGSDTPPADGVVYTVGQTLGNSTIISVSNATTFTDPGLTIGSTYSYMVLGYNDGTCYGITPSYNIVDPLFNTTTIPSCSSTVGGTYTVGPTGTYPTLFAAMTALNNAAGASGNIIVELQSTYTSAGETFPIIVPNISTSPCAVGNPTLTIRPAAGATGLVITGSNATAILDFNNTQRATLDGRPGGVGTAIQLTVINTNTAGVAIRLYNDASRNTITYCDVQGQNTGNGTSLTGVIYIGQANATALNGNDYNTISFNNIHGTATGTPAIGINSFGTTTTAATYNDSCSIINNRIYDYFNATTSSTGVKLDAGNNAWTVTGNSLYQTATRTYTTATTHRGFWITPNVGSIINTAGDFLIANNYIGGTAVNAGGTPYTMAGAIANVFMGMDLSLGGGTASSVQNNVVANIALTSTGTSTTAGVFTGIGIANGNVNVGTAVGNVIGSATTLGSINVTSGSAGTSYGIRLASGALVNIANNIISGYTGSGSTAAVSTNFTGIAIASGTTVNVTSNIIGSTTLANSINLTSTGTATAQSITGINVTGGTTVNLVTNTIANLTNAYTNTGAGTTRGISVSSSTGAATGNIINNLRSATLSTNGGATSALIGIASTTASGNFNIIGNTIHTLVSTAATTTAALNFTGIFYSNGSASVNTIARNFIHSFDAPSDSSITFTGLDYATGLGVVANNMIRLGIKPDGTGYNIPTTQRGISSNSSTAQNSFYYNSIFIGGTGLVPSIKTSYAFIRTAASGTYDMKNNIFANVRSNATTGGKHYGLYFTTATAGVSLNYNVYQVSGTGGVFAYNGTADVASFAGNWLAGDANSAAGNPAFINPTGSATTVDLHINTAAPSIAESAGTPVAAINDDIDGTTRSVTLPDAGADEFIGNNPNICNGTPTPGTISSTQSPVCTGSPFTLTVLNASGTPGTSYQWQSSSDGVNWTNITGANTAAYSTAQGVATYYRIVVSCSGSGLSANAPGLQIPMTTPTYAIYNGTGFQESFENWVNVCNVTDAPTLNWRNTVYLGNTSWRRDDQGASASWTTTGGGYTPVFSVGAHSARFHSSVVSGFQGNLDFYVNMAAAGAFTNIKFDYINTSGVDSLTVLISTDGGLNFTRLDSVGVRGAWTKKTIGISTNSATTVIRLQGTAVGNAATDIGVDNFELVNFATCSTTPVAGTISSTVSAICPNVSFNIITTGATEGGGITYQWQSSANGSTNWTNIAGANGLALTTSQIAGTYYRLIVTCTLAGGGFTTSNTVMVNVNSFLNCYCTPTYSNGGSGDNVSSVTLLNLSQTGITNVTPFYINYTATQTVIPVLARGSTYPLVLTFGTDNNQYNGVWVDFNQDGIFGTTEFFSSLTNTAGGGTVTVNIVVPANAVIGNTRLRIRGGDDSQPTNAQACGASGSTYGEGLDFLVNIDFPLPVKLLSFKGERKGINNDLTWVTASELNNKGFELQRSADGVNFSALGFVASKAVNGTSNSNLTYTFSDAKALAGNNYYRLKQIDKDGKSEYSNIVFLKGDKLNTLMISVIYPNPVTDKLNVIIASPKADKLTLVVSDVTGKIVSKQNVTAVTGDNKYEVNVQMLNSGNYIIKAICNEGCETVVSKFTKQ